MKVFIEMAEGIMNKIKRGKTNLNAVLVTQLQSSHCTSAFIFSSSKTRQLRLIQFQVTCIIYLTTYRCSCIKQWCSIDMNLIACNLR